MKDLSWTADSRQIDTLSIEIEFLLKSSFYVGNPNSDKQYNDRKYHEPMPLPGFTRATETSATTAEVYGNEQELIRYYRRIVERAASLGMRYNSLCVHFWLRLRLWNETEGVRISFALYDSLSEMQQFIGWLSSSQEEAFWDRDQCWQVDAVQESGFLYIRELDPDYDDYKDNLRVPLCDLAASAKIVERRAQVIIDRLTEGLGVDVWSKYIEQATFGTDDWKPINSTNWTSKS